MKLREIKNMGSLENRIYNGLYRFIMFGDPWGINKGFYYGNKGSMKDLSQEINDLEIQDILDIYSEEDLMRARNLGSKSISRLKELA